MICGGAVLTEGPRGGEDLVQVAVPRRATAVAPSFQGVAGPPAGQFYPVGAPESPILAEDDLR